MLLEYEDSLDTTRSTELSTVQVIVLPFWVNRGVAPFSTHMEIRVLRKTYEALESLAVSPSNCTVANRSRSWTKTGAYSFICTAPARGKSHMGERRGGFGHSQSIHCIWAQISLLSIVHWSSRIRHKHTIFCVSGAFTKKKKKRSCRLWACIFSRQVPRYFAGTICLSWGFVKYFFLKLGAPGFRSRGSPVHLFG